MKRLINNKKTIILITFIVMLITFFSCTLKVNAATYTLTIRYHANGGTIADAPHLNSNTYFKLSSSIVQKSTSANGTYSVCTNTIASNGTYINLWNVASFNITRTGYHIDGTKAYRTTNATSGALINQDTTATSSTNAATPYRLNNNASVTANKTVTLYVNWIVNTYSVAYNANGGSGTMSNSSHTYGTAKALTTNSYTRDGYTFVGWNTKADGSGTSYSNGQSVNNLTATNNGTVTLYAQWRKISGYTVTANANGGTISETTGWTGTGNTATKDIAYGSAYGTLPTPTRSGYFFTGWSYVPTGYQQLDYIESTGTQYIDTLYKPNANTGVEATYQFTDLTYQQRVFGVEGAAGTTGSMTYAHYINGSGNLAYAYQDLAGNWVNTGVAANTSKQTFKLNVDKRFYQIDNNTSQPLSGTVSNTALYNLYLMARANNTTTADQFAKLKLYQVNIYENGTLVKRFVPAERESDNAVGMYETVNGAFYANSGTGTFTAGNNTDVYTTTTVSTLNDHTLYAKWYEGIVKDKSGGCTWEIDNNGKMTIYPEGGGTCTLGASTGNQMPWYDYRTQITSVEVSQGVKANADSSYLFLGLTNVTSIDVSKLDTSSVINMKYMFSSCSSLTNLDLSNFDTDSVTNMKNMFDSCSSLTELDVTSFNTNNVTNMSKMFYNCNKLTELDVTNFNTSNVTDMSVMFYNCNKLTELDVTNFNTSNVTDMNRMFLSCSSLTEIDVSHFNTNNVTDMNSMFSGCESLTELDVTHFNTSNVTDMSSMFQSCRSLTELDVTGFNTNNVTRMDSMFYGCSSLTELDVTNFNTQNVTNMRQMFCDCSLLAELDVTGFNTSNVRRMDDMFQSCSALTQLDVTHFNTSNVTNMSYMFHSCNSLTELDLSNFDMADVTDVNHMFYRIGLNQNGGCKLILNNTFDNATYAVYSGYDFPWEYYAKETNGTLSSNLYTLSQMQTEVTGSNTATTWVPAYSVTYDGNGGTINSNNTLVKTYRIGNKINAKNVTPVKISYDFIKWNNSADGSGSLTVNKNGESANAYGTKYSYVGLTNGNITLYAQYTVNTYTITANANGGTIPSTTGWTGTGSTATKEVNAGSAYGTLPTPTKEDYTFGGWYTAASGGTQVTSSTTASANADIYAHWTYNGIAEGESGGCAWKIDNQGKMTIYPLNGVSCTLGAATNDNGTYKMPWYSYRNQITNVEVSSGVSANANSNYLFADLEHAEDIDINNLVLTNVTSAYGMFSKCRSVTEIDLEAAIGGTFSRCTDFQYMFDGCYSLERLDLSGVQINTQNTWYMLRNVGCDAPNGVLLALNPTFSRNNADNYYFPYDYWSPTTANGSFNEGTYGDTLYTRQELMASEELNTLTSSYWVPAYSVTYTDDAESTTYNYTTAVSTSQSGSFYNMTYIHNITVTITDENGDPVPNMTLDLSTSLSPSNGLSTSMGGAYSASLQLTTNSSGQVQFFERSSVNTYSVTATPSLDGKTGTSFTINNIGSSTFNISEASSVTGTPNPQAYRIGTNVDTRGYSATKTGYTLNNWNTASNGSGTVFAKNAQSSTAYGTNYSTTGLTNGNITLYAQFSDTTAPTVSDIGGGTTVKSTSQDLTLKCSDTVGVTAYYWGTTEPTSASSITTTTQADLTSLASSAGLTKNVTSAGTYWLGCRDAAGNYAKKSITIRSYSVDNRLLTLTGTKASYTSGNYTSSSIATYLAKDGTSLTAANIYTIPTGATSSTFKGYNLAAASTSPATLTSGSTAITLDSNKTITMWFDRTEYTITINSGANGSTKAETVTQTGNSATAAAGGTATLTVRYGDTVKATATPSTGYSFTGYSGGYISGTTNPQTGAAVTANRTITGSFADNTKPTNANITSTNNVATSQTATLSCSDTVGVTGYYWGNTGYSESSEFTSITSATSMSVTKTVSNPGTYYLVCRDAAGNISTQVSKTFYKTTLTMTNGTVSPASVITMDGNSFSLPTPTATTGYTNEGNWYTNSGMTAGAKAYGTSYSPSSNATLYSKADINKYTVQLNVTNGTGAATKNNVEHYSTTSFTGVSPNEGYGNGTVSCTNGQEATLSGTTVTTEPITYNTVCTVTFTGNDIAFGDKTVNLTYSTSAQTINVDQPTGGTGTYTFSKVTSGSDADITVSSAGVITVPANKAKGTYTVKVKATDSGSGKTKEATYTIVIGAQTCATPTNVAISTAGRVTWTPSSNCSSAQHQISIDGTNWTNATSGVDYLDTIIASTGSRTVYVRAVAPNTNYNNSANGTKATTVYTLTINSNNTNYGTVDTSSYKVIAGTTYSASSNTLNITGVTSGTTTTTLATSVASPNVGHAFTNWSSTSGTINSNTTVTANFSISSYTVTADANGGTISSTTGWTGTGSTATKSIAYESTYGTLPTVNRTGYTLKGWKLLPEGYKQVEYIESTGTQYIDTGYYWNNENVEIYFDGTVVNNPSAQSLFGNEEYKDSSNRNFAGIPHGTNGSYSIYLGSGAQGSVSTTIGTRFNLDIKTSENKNMYVYKDGNKILDKTYSGTVLTKQNANITSSASTNVGNIFLFSNHNSNHGSSNGATQIISDMKVYNFKLADGGIIVRDLVPCIRESDNKVGMYDLVNNEFYDNSGSGSFTAGEEVYITSSTKNMVAGPHTIYAHWTANELTFENKTITKTYSEAAQTDTITPATNGTGSYTYTEISEKKGTVDTNYISITNGTTINIQTGTPVGTYTYVIKAKDTVSGAEKNATYTINITKKKATLSVADSSKTLTYKTAGTNIYTYDGDGTVTCQSSDTTKVTCSVNTTNHTITVTPVAATSSPVTITVKASDGTNYSAADNKTFTVTVNKFTPTIATTPKSAVYTGSKITANQASVTLTNGETYSGTINYTYYNGTGCSGTALSDAPINVGTYSVKASIAAQGNYNAAEKCVTHTITKSNTTTTLSDQTKTYTGSAQPASGATSTLSSTSSLISGGTYTYTYYSNTNCSGTGSATAPTNAGEYSVTATLAGTDNYNTSTSACTTYTMNKKDDTVNLTAKSAAYTGSPISANTATATSGTSITYTYYSSTDCTGTALSGAPTNVGNYSVKAVSSGNSNYNSDNKCVTHTITKSNTTTTLSNQTKTYNGSSQPASGATSKLSSNNSNISGGSYTYTYYNGDSCSGTGSTTAPTNAGIYSVTATLAGTSNYNTSTSSCATYTMNKKKATITLTDSTKQLNYGGSAGTNTYTYDGDGTVTCQSSDTTKVTCMVDTTNHKITVTPVAVTSSPVTITVKASDGTNYSAADNKTFTVTVGDNTPPTNANITSTNNVTDVQTATLSCQDNVGVVSYYFGTSAPTASSTYTTVTSTENFSTTKTIDTEGTYYLACRDAAGNTSAVVHKNFYKTTFNMTNGTISPENVLTMETNSFNLPTPTATTGYTNEGKWYTNSAMTSGAKAYGTSYSPSANATLYSKAEKNKYEIKVNVVNGTGTSTKTVDYNESETFTVKPKTGYGSGAVSCTNNQTGTLNGTTLTVSNVKNNTVCTVTYNPNSYVIKFNNNTGTGSMSNLSMTYDEAKNLTKNTFTKTNYTFTGWNTKADGSGTNYTDEQSVKNLATSGEITLYAKWQGNPYTIAFNANTGTGSMSNLSARYGETYTLPANAFTKKGYTFTGWNTKADGTGTNYADEDEVTSLAASGTVTLYAKWNKFDVIMKYTDNDASLETDINDNYLYYNILVQKKNFTILKVDDESSDPLQGAEFTLTGTSTYGNTVNTTITTGANGQAVFNNIEYGTYTLTESHAPTDYKENSTQYTVTVGNTVQITGLTGNNGVFTIENELARTYSDLKVSKKVTGNMGDVDKTFAYTINFTKLDASKTYQITGTPNSFTSDSSGNATVNFNLKHNAEITFKDLPEKATYKVTETGTEYEPTYNLVSDGSRGEPVFVNQNATGTKDNNLATSVETIDRTDGNVTVKFTNNYDSEIETGFFKEKSLPLIVIIVSALTLVIFVIVRVRVKEV